MSRAAVSLLALCCVLWIDAAPRTAARRPAYDAIRRQLRASAVPVLLPVPIPPALGPVRSIAVISADRAGYYVGFSPIAHCSGALSCAFFHVAGYWATPSKERPDRRDRRVWLFDGTRGTFRPKDCSGASCTEASLSFTRLGAVYELDAKVSADALAALESAYRRLRIVR